MNLDSLLSAVNSQKSPSKAKDYQWFFKTGKGQYGEGDKFLGIVMPQIRQLVRYYWDVVDLNETISLLHNQYHEIRMLALLILAKKYSENPKKIFEIYLNNTKYINNWDLVDLSARDIVGRYAFEYNKYSIIKKLSQSQDLWEKRISIISTSFFIGKNNFHPTLEISDTLLSDPHDLIHKAVGWMLREVGKRDQTILLNYLNTNALNMSRTTLRYAIEKFPEELRQHYLKLK